METLTIKFHPNIKAKILELLSSFSSDELKIVQEDETVQDEIFPDSFQELINGDAPQDQPFYFYSDDLLSGTNSQNSEKIIFALLIALFYSANFTQIQLKKTIEWA